MSKRRSHIKRAKVLREGRSATRTSWCAFLSAPLEWPRKRLCHLTKRGRKRVRRAQAMRGYYQD